MPKTETVTFKANTSHFKRGIREMAQRAKAFAGTMTKVSAIAIPLAGVAAGVKSVGSAFDAVGKAAMFEDLELQLANVLKSSQQAKSVFGEIMQFSASTPFQIDGITKGVTALTQANKELGTSKELWIEVGDLAARGGKNFEDIAQQASKFFSAIQSENGSIATPLESLAGDMGVISPLAKDGLIALKASGASAETLSNAFRKIMQDSAGSAKRMSSTWNGLISTLKDVKTLVMASFGSGIINNLKPIITDLTRKLKSWIPIAKEWGDKVAKTVKTIYLAFASGNGLKVMQLGLKIVAKTFAGYLWEGLKWVASKFAEKIKEVGKDMAVGMAKVVLPGSGLLIDQLRAKQKAQKSSKNEFENNSFLDTSGDLKHLKSLLNPAKIKEFDEENKDLKEGKNVEQQNKQIEPIDFTPIALALVDKVAKLDISDIKTKIKDKFSSISDGAKNYIDGLKGQADELRRKLEVERFEGNSTQLRPISDLSSHGGGGVYGTTGTQRHEQMILRSTQEIERHLAQIARYQSENKGGATFR